MMIVLIVVTYRPAAAPHSPPSALSLDAPLRGTPARDSPLTTPTHEPTRPPRFPTSQRASATQVGQDAALARGQRDSAPVLRALAANPRRAPARAQLVAVARAADTRVASADCTFVHQRRLVCLLQRGCLGERGMCTAGIVDVSQRCSADGTKPLGLDGVRVRCPTSHDGCCPPDAAAQ